MFSVFMDVVVAHNHHKHVPTNLFVLYLLFILWIFTETETELNVEVAFSEQALSYRDNHQKLKVTNSLNSPDDKLPVSHLHTHTIKAVHQIYIHMLCKQTLL